MEEEKVFVHALAIPVILGFKDEDKLSGAVLSAKAVEMIAEIVKEDLWTAVDSVHVGNALNSAKHIAAKGQEGWSKVFLSAVDQRAAEEEQ